MQKLKNLRYTYMIVLTTNSTQQITFIPNNYSSEVLSFEFQDETTKSIYTKSAQLISFNKDLRIVNITTLDFLQENTFYNLKVYLTNDTSVIVFKDRVFCTNQPKDTYSINNGQYITPTIDNNSYITL